MSFYKKQKGKKYHKRSIDVSISDFDDRRFVIEGCLTDQRYQPSHILVEDIEACGSLREVMAGAIHSPGILHQMVIHLLVNKDTMVIEDLHVEIPAAPREECQETLDSLNPIKGVSIASGFMSKIRGLAGDGKGCRHMVELLIAMAPAIIQGAISHRISQPACMLTPELVKRYVNTCHVWRPDGTLVSQLEGQKRPHE